MNPFVINIENHSDTPKSFKLFGGGRTDKNFGNPEGVQITYGLPNYAYVMLLTDTIVRPTILANVYCKKKIALRVIGVNLEYIKFDKVISSSDTTAYVDELSKHGIALNDDLIAIVPEGWELAPKEKITLELLGAVR